MSSIKFQPSRPLTEERPESVVAQYEHNLCYCDDWLNDRAKLKSLVERHGPGWKYDHLNNRLTQIDAQRADLGTWVNDQLASALKAFCENLSLATVLCQLDANTEPQVVLTLAARELEIRSYIDRLEVVIPSYYSLSHIRTHSHSDFLKLKIAMQAKQKSMGKRKPTKFESREERLTAAKKYLQEGQAAGLSGFAAWEYARVRMGWKIDTARHRLRTQPEASQRNAAEWDAVRLYLNHLHQQGKLSEDELTNLNKRILPHTAMHQPTE